MILIDNEKYSSRILNENKIEESENIQDKKPEFAQIQEKPINHEIEGDKQVENKEQTPISNIYVSKGKNLHKKN